MRRRRPPFIGRQLIQRLVTSNPSGGYVARVAAVFGAVSAADTWAINDLSDPATKLGQSPMRSPTGFNFFRPGDVPPNSAIAVEQYGATLASWFGVSASDQASVLPNLANFSTRNLGFMAPAAGA